VGDTPRSPRQAIPGTVTLTIVILSPHTDDAIFSLGQHLTTLDSDVPLVIASVFAGIPEDDAGHRKHKRLRAEHELACEIIGAAEWNGDYLDDVYQPRPTVTEIRDWIVKACTELDATTVYIPLGIHHPDHVSRHSRSTRTPQIAPTIRLYADLPYHTDYPGLSRCAARTSRRNTRPTQTTHTGG
jgi:LmbE family N-acetylglucosaminyl deacetylase